jgi:pimeloyl-ACP methyl ester carboxylesterase
MPIAAGLYYFAHQDKIYNKPPVILIHGAGGSHLSWPTEVRRLAGYDVYALDLPGHGKSEAHGEQSIRAYAEHILRWMESVNQYRVILVGHSMGAAIALTVAHTNPARVAGLCLIGIGVPIVVPADLIENLSNPAMVSAALNQIKALSFSPDAAPRRVALASRQLADMRTSVIRGDFLACSRFNLEEVLDRPPPPALIIAGSQDQMVPLRYQQLLAKKLKGAEFGTIPDAGHMVMLEKPQELAERLSHFLHQHEFIT